MSIGSKFTKYYYLTDAFRKEFTGQQENIY